MLAVGCPTQDIKDTTYRPDEDAPLIAEDLAKWRKDAVEYMTMARMDAQQLSEMEKKKQEVKLQRVASYRHLRHLDAQLRAVMPGCLGLKTFTASASDEAGQKLRLEQLPLLILTEDEHSVNMASQWYMLYSQKLRLATYPDPWHRVWNDCSEGVKSSGFNIVVQLTTLCMNLPYGPWEGQKFFQEVAEAGSDLVQLMHPEDPLLQEVAHQIEEEMQVTGSFEDDKKEWLVQQLRGAAFLQKKGCHISPTRWFDWNNHFGEWASEWSLRYLCLVFLGLQVGYLRRQSTRSCMLSLKGRLNRPSDTPLTTQGGKAEVQQVRDRCANGLHVSTIIHADKAIYHLAMMIRHCTRGMREWYGKWNPGNRSRQGCLQFSISLASGTESFDAVWAILNWTSQAQSMMQSGFLVEELVNSPASFRGLSVAHDVVAQQDEHAEKLDRLQWALVGCRVGSLSRHMCLPPRSFAILLAEDDGLRQWGLQVLRKQWEAWQSASSLTTPFWKQVITRSPFQWELNKNIMEHLVDNGWQITDELNMFLVKINSQLGSTTPVEVSFQKNRRAEAQRPDKVVNSLMCWQHPVRAHVLSHDFGFREVDMESVAENPSIKACRIPATMFNPPSKRQSMNFRTIVGRGNAQHPSFSPGSSKQLVEDLHLTVYLKDQGLLDQGCRCWRSKLMVPGLVVYCKKYHGGKVFFSLGVHANCCCLWPAERTQAGGQVPAGMYQLMPLKSCADLTWAPIIGFADWKVLETKAISPVHAFCLNNRKPLDPLPSTLRLQVGRRPRPLIEVAAMAGFWQLKADFIDKLLREEYATRLQGTPFPERVLTLIELVLGCSREEGAEILEARTIEAPILDGGEEVLASEECQAMMSKDEQQECDRALDGAAKAQAGTKDFARLVKSVRLSAKGKKAAKPKRPPVAWPGDGPRAVLEDHLNSLMPSGYYIRRDPFNGRWRAHHTTSPWSCGRSWGAGQEAVCTKSCVIAAWARAEELEGQECHVTGLLGKAAAPPSVSSSSATPQAK